MKSWKTTLFGILTAAGAIASMVHTGSPDTQSIATALGGIGLILAKDHNVTGQ